MNKAIENTLKRGYETAAVVHKISGLDLQVGDTVQIRSGDYAGRVGVVIGISYEPGTKGCPFLSYCVKFTDTEGVRFPSGRLRLVKPYERED